MKITRIEIQKNNDTRFNLFSGEKYVGSASYESLLKYGFVEFEIPDEEFEDLLEKEDIEKAFNRCLKYVSRALKTKKEVRDYLYKLKVDPNSHDEILDRLEDLKLIDDERYLEIYLDDKFNYSSDGSTKIKSKLFLKGFNSSELEPHLEKYRDKERKNLKKLVSQKKSPKDYKEKNKLVRYLMSKGYDYSMISEVLGEFSNDEF